jgi:hypothetical protein
MMNNEVKTVAKAGVFIVIILHLDTTGRAYAEYIRILQKIWVLYGKQK